MERDVVNISHLRKVEVDSIIYYGNRTVNGISRLDDVVLLYLD